ARWPASWGCWRAPERGRAGPCRALRPPSASCWRWPCRRRRRAANGVFGHLGDGELGLGAEAFADRARPHVFHIDRLAVDLARRLVAADDEQGGNVEAGGGHQVARRGLVAARQADHAVEQGGFHLYFDIVGDNV